MDKNKYPHLMPAWHPESTRTRLTREHLRAQRITALEWIERHTPRCRWTQTPGDTHNYTSLFDHKRN